MLIELTDKFFLFIIICIFLSADFLGLSGNEKTVIGLTLNYQA